MENRIKKASSVVLALMLVLSMVMPGFTAFAAGETITITDSNGAEITSTVEVQEYRTVQLSYVTSDGVPDTAYVTWESNLPLLADVDDTGKVTGYDYSKAAIIQLWLDEQVRTMPVVGDAMATAIENAITNSGYDLETVNTDILVTLVRGIAGDAIADSLKNYLDNMNVVITATLFDEQGNKLASDTVDVLVTQSIIASVAPTGVRITNKKTVPTTVAVGATVQLYGACTPVRLKQGIKWSMGSNVFDTSSANHATVSSDGLVTFTSAGTATVRVNPENTLYAAFTDTITFTVVEQSELPLTDFTITGTTSVQEGATTQLAVDDIKPAGAYTGDLVWSSSDPTVAAVDQNGIVTGLDGGSGLVFSKTAVITAKIGTIEKQVTVTVSRSLVSSTISGVEISGDTVIANDSPAQYTATVTPARLNTNSSVSREWGLQNTDGTVVWATSSTPASNSLASITSDGLLTPSASGVITIAARATYNSTVVESRLQVTAGKAITDFSISGSTSVTEAATVQLSITNITPTDYDENILASVEWTSADPSIATVDKNGVVTGIDGGGLGSWSTKTVNITATIGGVSKSVTITVKGSYINYITNATINGYDYVVKDFPVSYTSTFSPARMSISKTLWGLPDNEGTAPWTASNTLNSSNNMENDVASVTDAGLVTGKTAGTTTLHLFGRHNYTSHYETTKEISVVEIEPKSISITAPTKTNYVEGDTVLDLTGLKVSLTYDREDIREYYGDYADTLTDAQLTVDATDYTVSEIKQAILDSEQYIIVTVTRAGKEYRGIFGITLESKALTSIDITNPKYQYLEGETTLDLSGLTVTANYSNVLSEQVSDYTVNTAEFNPTLFNVEQNITVEYSHAGRSATKTFPVIVYGIPVVSVDTDGYDGGWTGKAVTFNLDSTNKLDGVTYFYRTDSNSEWKAVTGSSLTVSTNQNETYYFKATNSKNIESAETVGYTVKYDNVTPAFELTQAVTDITNQSYSVSIDNISVGDSGVKSITLNGNDITGNTSFTVDENGVYEVTVTANNGLFALHSVTVENIDKTAPSVTGVSLEHKNTGGFARFINTVTFGLFFNEEVEVTIDAVDEGVAGIDKIEYRYLDENGQPLSAEWSVYSNSDKPVREPDFKGYVQAKVTDKAGNVSELFCSDGFVIDATAPTDVVIDAAFGSEAYTSGEWVSDSVSISLSSDAFSGIFSYLYRIDGGEWQTLEGNTITATLEGEHLYEFKAVSNSAIDSEISSITVKIDRQVPVIRVDFAGTFGRWTSEDVTFTFATLASSLSGVTYYYDNGNSWVEITSGNEIVLSDNVNATYKFKAVNGAGTESNPSDSYKVMIDSATPTVTATQTVTDSTCVPYNIDIVTTFGASGIKSVTMNGTDITGQSAVEISENGTYLFIITGNNLKTSSYILQVTNFYTPVLEITDITFSPDVANKTADGEFYKESTTVSISAQNTGVTGISKIEYRLISENGTPISDWTLFDSNNKPLLTGEFKGSVEARVFDNNEAVSDSFVSQVITVDTNAPSLPIVSAVSDLKEYTGGWTDKEVTLALSSTAFSGVAGYSYRVDGGMWQTLSESTLKVNNDGEHNYEFKAISNSTLESEITSFTTRVEKATPELFVYSNITSDEWANSNAVFFFSSVNTNSGVTYYYNDGTGFKAVTGNVFTVDSNNVSAYTFKAVNGVGNESAVSDEYIVKIDKTTPTISAVADITEFTNGNVTIDVSTDNIGISGIKVVNVNGNDITGESKYQVNANGDYVFTVTDNNGLSSSVTVSVNNIDKIAPVVSGVEFSAGAVKENYYDSSVTLTINSVDNGVSGIKSVEYKIADGEWLNFDSSNKPVIDGDFNEKIQVRVTDNAGNVSDVFESENIVVEKTMPTDVTLNAISGGAEYLSGNWTATDVDITLSGSAYSGIEKYLVKVDNGEWQTLSGNTFSVSESGEHTLYFKSVSNAGHESAVAVTEVKVEKEAPVLTVAANGTFGSWTNEGVNFTLSSSSTNSGVTYYYDDGEGFKAIEGNTLYLDTNQNKTYIFKAVNGVGNESAVSEDYTVMLDVTGVSVVTVDAQLDGKQILTGMVAKGDLTISVASDAFSGIAKYQYSLNGSEWADMDGNSVEAQGEGVYNYKFRAISTLGDISAETEYTVTVRYYLLGDVNDDGKVNSADARWVMQYSAGLREFDARQFAAADVNLDGKVNSSDARWLLQVSAGLRVL